MVNFYIPIVYIIYLNYINYSFTEINLFNFLNYQFNSRILEFIFLIFKFLLLFIYFLMINHLFNVIADSTYQLGFIYLFNTILFLHLRDHF